MGELEVVGLGAVEEALSRQYAGAMRVLPAGPGTGRMRLSSLHLERARLDRVRFDMAFAASGPALGGLIVAVVRRGRLRVSWSGHEQDYLPGDVCVTAQPGLPFSVEHHQTEADVVVIDPALLQAVATPDVDADAVRFTDPAPHTARDAEWWRSVCVMLRGQSVTEGGAGAHPLVAAAAARLLAATALATFPNTVVPQPSTADSRDARPRSLRRAMAYLEENADRDVSLADVAAAVSVSPRALQLAFRRHLDTTPTDHLRSVRLEQARRELRRSSPEETTVTAVAARWGFLQPSRFAARYRAAFGELPSETLHG